MQSNSRNGSCIVFFDASFASMPLFGCSVEGGGIVYWHGTVSLHSASITIRELFTHTKGRGLLKKGMRREEKNGPSHVHLYTHTRARAAQFQNQFV